MKFSTDISKGLIQKKQKLCSSQDLSTFTLGLGHKTSVEDIFSQRHSYLSELNTHYSKEKLSKDI